MAENKTIKDELLISFHEQFAVNQNHHQTVFLQFLSAILAVLLGYGYIYANTTTDAYWFDLHRGLTKTDILSYSVFHLFGVLLISELILTLLCNVSMNIGYGFRRDQLVVHRIRKNYLAEDREEYLGKASFNPEGLDFVDYLPEFNRMFTIGIVLLQFVLWISFMIALLVLKGSWEKIEPMYTLAGSMELIVSLLPIAWTYWLYCNFYKKYRYAVLDSIKPDQKLGKWVVKQFAPDCSIKEIKVD